MKDYSFGNYICALRTGLGLSQFQLGTLVGVTDKAVSKWENGDAKPRLATCYRLAEVLGVSINELLSCNHHITIPARKELDKMNHKLWREAYEKLSLYGKTPPAEYWSRLAAEEAALQGTDAVQGFAVLGKIRKEALAHDSAIIVAGTLNSSFAAWLFGATNVNPLPPHYICTRCGRTEFLPDASDGFDLPAKRCSCGHEFLRDGHDLPYEDYVKAERAGTHVEVRVSKKFKPIAVNILMDFYKGIAEVLPVKLTGDHEAWSIERYVVLPQHKAKPPLAADGFWHVGMDEYWTWYNNETTFTFSNNKQLDEIQRLQEITKTKLPNPFDHINLQMADALYQRRHKKASFITNKIPPHEAHDFDLLLRIDGLAHATGAWTDNSELLVENRKARFREIPATREDIWNDVCTALMKKGIRDNGLSMQVMEKTIKGLYCSQGIPKSVEVLLLSLGLPEWYPGYLKKILYLFPKGHCIAYLLVDIIYEWYHINYPSEFYQCTSKS